MAEAYTNFEIPSPTGPDDYSQYFSIHFYAFVIETLFEFRFFICLSNDSVPADSADREHICHVIIFVSRTLAAELRPRATRLGINLIGKLFVWFVFKQQSSVSRRGEEAQRRKRSEMSRWFQLSGQLMIERVYGMLRLTTKGRKRKVFMTGFESLNAALHN